MSERANLDRRVMRLFDGYVHGQITRREFLDRAAAFTAAGVGAAALLSSLSPDYALAQQVDPDDKSISVGHKKYKSPKGAGVMQGYYVRPAVNQHKLPAVVVIHENRGLNSYIEDVARRLGVAGFIAFAPDALTPLGGYPGNDDDGRELQRQRDKDEMVEDFVAAVEFENGAIGSLEATRFAAGRKNGNSNRLIRISRPRFMNSEKLSMRKPSDRNNQLGLTSSSLTLPVSRSKKVIISTTPTPSILQSRISCTGMDLRRSSTASTISSI